MPAVNIDSFRLSTSRRHVTMLIAIDISISMGARGRNPKTRLQVASEGGCRVVDKLQDSDHMAILAFGDEIKDVSSGVVETNAREKARVKREIMKLSTAGQTKLYDTILFGCKCVLEIAAALHAVGQVTGEDCGTFWLVVLTDGEDNRSTGSLAETENVLRALNAELGPEVLKILLIGVQLENQARGNLERLSRAGGATTTFVDARQLDQVTQAFDEIAVQIEMSRVQIGMESIRIEPSNDDAPWTGQIQKGMHVRCVGTSRGAAGVSVGDVGVVQGRDSDGDYLVDFPKCDKWCARPSDIIVDEMAERIRPGALVAIKPSITRPSFGLGNYRRGMHGLVMSVSHDGMVQVQFGFGGDAQPQDSLFKALLSELEIVDDGHFVGPFPGHWPGKLQLGQAVRVPLRLETPSTGWGSLVHERGQVGYVRKYLSESNSYVCDFPSQDGWKGRPEDLEVEAVASLVRPGKKVRVRRGITPHYKWGSVSATSVGTVVSCEYDGSQVVVNFPEDKAWKGRLTDLETLDRPPTEVLTRVQNGTTTCPGGHGLCRKFTECYKERTCDFCGSEMGPVGTMFYGCHLCNCDACTKCYSGDISSAPPTTPERASTRSSSPSTPTTNSTMSSSASSSTSTSSEPAVVTPDRHIGSSLFQEGDVVQIKGLSSQKGAPFNGKLAKIQSKADATTYVLKMLHGDQETIKLKTDKVMTPRQTIRTGAIIRFQNLTNNVGLNGTQGEVLAFDSTKAKYRVEYQGHKQAWLYAENLEVLQEEIQELT